MSASRRLKDETEYLRRNLLHCKTVGTQAIAVAALQRLQKQKRPPQWLVACLDGIAERVAPVAAEMAVHRDEVW